MLSYGTDHLEWDADSRATQPSYRRRGSIVIEAVEKAKIELDDIDLDETAGLPRQRI